MSTPYSSTLDRDRCDAAVGPAMHTERLPWRIGCSHRVQACGAVPPLRSFVGRLLLWYGGLCAVSSVGVVLGFAS